MKIGCSGFGIRSSYTIRLCGVQDGLGEVTTPGGIRAVGRDVDEELCSESIRGHRDCSNRGGNGVLRLLMWRYASPAGQIENGIAITDWCCLSLTNQGGDWVCHAMLCDVMRDDTMQERVHRYGR